MAPEVKNKKGTVPKISVVESTNPMLMRNSSVPFQDRYNYAWGFPEGTIEKPTIIKTVLGGEKFPDNKKGIDPDLYNAVKSIGGTMGEGYRTVQRQQDIRDKFGYKSNDEASGSNGRPMASKPGFSNHNYGRAIDVDSPNYSSYREKLADELQQNGNIRLDDLIKGDARHYEIANAHPNYYNAELEQEKQGIMKNGRFTLPLSQLVSSNPEQMFINTDKNATIQFMKDRGFTPQEIEKIYPSKEPSHLIAGYKSDRDRYNGGGYNPMLVQNSQQEEVEEPGISEWFKKITAKEEK